MMYQNKLAVAIKHNGKFLREEGDLVKIPFGSEFSVLVKNLNSKRVKFTLHIDGTDALDGEEIVVNGNAETEIKRFIRNGNMDEGNAFKFIERTAAIEDGPRGIKVDDGVVRVEFWFEQDKPEIKVKDIYWEKHHYRDYYQQPLINRWTGPFYGSTNIVGSAGLGSSISGASGSIARDAVLNQVNASFSATSASASLSDVADKSESIDSIIADALKKSAMPVNEVGITVPGSKVEQKFTTVYGFIAEANSHVIILRLVGKVGEVEIAAPITVTTKQKCSTCYKMNKSSSRFCSSCGTSLEII